MKKNSKLNLKIVVFLLVLLKMGLVFCQNSHAKKRILIDVGHGGKDPGAIGMHRLMEKEVVLVVAKELVRLNETVFENRLEVFLTRYEDRFISLSDRSRLTKVLNIDLFVSLHGNAGSANAKGMEVYVSTFDHFHSKNSVDLGTSILKECASKLGFHNRGVKFAVFQVLRESRHFCPSILVELGFVTHGDEAAYFLKTENTRALALAILMGIVAYLK